MARAWRCPHCAHINDDARKVCQGCYEFRPNTAAGKATHKNDKLRAGDKVLGYELDANLKPVRHFLHRRRG